MAFNEEDKEELKVQFIKKYKKTKTISTAIDGMNLGRTTLYEWFQEDPEFKQAFDNEKLAVGEGLESKAFQLIDKMIEKNDYGRPVLLITMLNAHLPERYKQSESAGDDSRQLIAEFRKMAKSKKPKAVTQAEDILKNDSDTK